MTCVGLARFFLLSGRWKLSASPASTRGRGWLALVLPLAHLESPNNLLKPDRLINDPIRSQLKVSFSQLMRETTIKMGGRREIRSGKEAIEYA